MIDQASGRPAIRVEYDRDQGNEPDDETPAQHGRSAAHVQIHGSSEELAYVQGLNGDAKLRGLERFHIPVEVRGSGPRSKTSSSSSGLSASSRPFTMDGRTS